MRWGWDGWGCPNVKSGQRALASCRRLQTVPACQISRSTCLRQRQQGQDARTPRAPASQPARQTCLQPAPVCRPVRPPARSGFHGPDSHSAPRSPQLLCLRYLQTAHAPTFFDRSRATWAPDLASLALLLGRPMNSPFGTGSRQNVPEQTVDGNVSGPASLRSCEEALRAGPVVISCFTPSYYFVQS